MKKTMQDRNAERFASRLRAERERQLATCERNIERWQRAIEEIRRDLSQERMRPDADQYIIDSLERELADWQGRVANERGTAETLRRLIKESE